MAEIAYLMGEDVGDNRYFAEAEIYFASLKCKIVKRKDLPRRELTLDAALDHLAAETTTYTVVHLVTHASGMGNVNFPLSLDPENDPTYLVEYDLVRALEDWQLEEAREKAAPAPKPLWVAGRRLRCSPRPLGGPPESSCSSRCGRCEDPRCCFC